VKKELIKKILENEKLTERRREILTMQFKGKTLQEIGDKFRRTRQRISQILESLESKYK